MHCPLPNTIKSALNVQGRPQLGKRIWKYWRAHKCRKKAILLQAGKACSKRDDAPHPHFCILELRNEIHEKHRHVVVGDLVGPNGSHDTSTATDVRWNGNFNGHPRYRRRRLHCNWPLAVTARTCLKFAWSLDQINRPHSTDRANS